MKITLQRLVPFPTAFQLGLQPDSTVLFLTFCFLCWHKCLLSGEGRKQVFTRRPWGGMPGKDAHIWNTFEPPIGIQNTASLSSEDKLDTRPSRQMTHGHHVPLKLPSRHTFPICSGRLQAAWKNLTSGHRVPITHSAESAQLHGGIWLGCSLSSHILPLPSKNIKSWLWKSKKRKPCFQWRCWHRTSLIIYTWWAYVQV